MAPDMGTCHRGELTEIANKLAIAVRKQRNHDRQPNT